MSNPDPSAQSAAEARRQDGNAAFSRGEYTIAVDLYTQCLALDSTSAQALCNRSLCRFKLEQFVC